MAIRSNDERNSERVKELENPSEREELSTVRLVLLRDVHLQIVGSASGQTYYFNGAGSICDVDSRDAEIFLQKDANTYSCCTGAKQSPYFELVR